MKQITAKQCAKIHPFLPVQRGNVRIWNIVFINALLFIMENGCKWRALPSRFGKWHSVYARFRRWSRSGVLDRLFAALRDLETDGADVKCFGLDSTSVKVHPDGTGARKASGPQSIGKSRGGWWSFGIGQCDHASRVPSATCSRLEFDRPRSVDLRLPTAELSCDSCQYRSI